MIENQSDAENALAVRPGHFQYFAEYQRVPRQANYSVTQKDRQSALPENADIEKISAHMEHGVLNILIPKLTPQEVKKNIRQIEIG